MPDSEISKQSPEVIYDDGKKRILGSIAGQSALPSDLRTALAEGVERIFNEFAGRESRAAASGGLQPVEETRDLVVELRERLIAELVKVWNEAQPDRDRYGGARVRKLENQGWRLSKATSSVLFAKHPDSEEIFFLPGMPVYFKGVVDNCFDKEDMTPDSREERVVVGLIKPAILSKEVAGRLIGRMTDWDNQNEMPMLVSLYAGTATKGLVKVKAY